MAKCFVVSLMRGGIKFYYKREDLKKDCGVFSPDLLDARKFTKLFEARFFC